MENPYWEGADAADAYGGLSDVEYQLAAVTAKCETLRQALKAVEWCPEECNDNVCHWCNWWKHTGHAPDCQRQAALALVEGDEQCQNA